MNRCSGQLIITFWGHSCRPGVSVLQPQPPADVQRCSTVFCCQASKPELIIKLTWEVGYEITFPSPEPFSWGHSLGWEALRMKFILTLRFGLEVKSCPVSGMERDGSLSGLLKGSSISCHCQPAVAASPRSANEPTDSSISLSCCFRPLA